MRVLLINPKPQKIHRENFFPLGIAYLAAVLEQNGLETKVLDFYSEPEKVGDAIPLQKEIDDFSPDIVGVGCLFSLYFPHVKEICRSIKSVNSRLLVVLGGLHPTIFHREILSQLEYIDFIILGEGEKSLLKLCLKLRNGEKLEDVEGLAYRNADGIKVNPKSSYIENLDELPFPAYHKFKMENYFYHYWYHKKNRGMSLLTSRACPNRCPFCSMFLSHGRKWRMRSSENVLNEMQFLYDNYHIRHFMFMDDNMNVDKSRTMEIFNGILERRLKITFNFPNGIAVNTLDRDVIEVMKKAGCKELSLGIESGSEYIRNRVIGKRLSDEKILEVLGLCNKYRIDTRGFLIFGLPGENEDTVDESIRFVKQLKGSRAVDFLIPHFATPFPGTALFQQCMREKLIDTDTMNKLIDDQIHPYDKPIIRLKTLSEEKIIKHRDEVLRIFYRQNFFRLLLRFLKPQRLSFRFLNSGVRYLISRTKKILKARLLKHGVAYE